jgi:hypothetical protein
MTSAEIRDELLSQHAALRGRLEAARLAVNRWASGEAPQARVREELAALAIELRSHNLREEEALRELERLRTRLLEHMAREEEAFLNTSVLRDDDLAIDAQGG